MLARRARAATALLTALLASVAAVACDESEVAHAPDFSLARMQRQPRVNPFEGMRTPVPFTVQAGATGNADPEAPPTASYRTRPMLTLGAAHFGTSCAVCHGSTGDGVSVVAEKMTSRPPPSLLSPAVRALDDTSLYRVVTHGYGLMGGYQAELTPEERWAVVGYLRALQLREAVPLAALTPRMRRELAEEAP